MKPLSEEALREKISRLIIENQSEDGSVDISDQSVMADELLQIILSDRKAWGELWYIVTEFGGPVVLGGFETKELALEVRQWLENRMNGTTYAIEQRQRNQGEKTDE